MLSRASFFVARLLSSLGIVALLAGCATSSDPSSALSLSASFPVDSPKYAAVVIDANNGRTLYQADSTAPRYPASLTKMMTLYMVFEALEAGRLTGDTAISVSANAISQPPTKIGFRAGETIDVDSAIKALVTKSANDVAVAFAERLGGSETAFAQAMTQRARQLGMTSTTFRNASGLPDPGQVTTARDMAILGLALRKRFPQYYRYFSTQDFVFRGRLIRGHNDLLKVAGVDGVKTGYTRDSGFNLVTSVRMDGRSLVAVVMGGATARSRNARMEALIGSYLPLGSRAGG